MAFNNWTNRSKEGMKEFISQWFEEAGSDIQEWTPVDWTSKLGYTHFNRKMLAIGEALQNSEYTSFFCLYDT